MSELEPVVHHICFLAVTRPAMFLGVTMEAFAINGMLTMVAFVLTGSFRILLIGLVFHFMARALVWQDHNRFRLLAAWMITRGRMLNTTYWGGSSPTPLTVSRPTGKRHGG